MSQLFCDVGRGQGKRNGTKSPGIGALSQVSIGYQCIPYSINYQAMRGIPSHN